MFTLNTKYTSKKYVIRHQHCDRYNAQTTNKFGAVMFFKALRSDAMGRGIRESREANTRFFYMNQQNFAEALLFLIFR